MPFRFGLETVLKYRKRLEEVAQREFAEAQQAVDRILSKIESMYERMDEVRLEIAHAQNSGTRESVEHIRLMEGFIVGEKIRIERLRIEARQLLVIAEEKQEALIFAAREKKILVKLKEKKFEQYRERLRLLETKELDDLTMMRKAREMR